MARKDDDRIFYMRLAGRATRAIAKELNMTVREVEDVIEARMLRLDQRYRLQVMAFDLERLDILMARYLKDAVNGSIPAGHLVLKIAERKAAMLGTDAPMRIDAVQLVQHVDSARESNHDKIERVLRELIEPPKDPSKH